MMRCLCHLAVIGGVFVSVAKADVPSSANLLPNTTKGWVSIDDINELSDRFDQSNLGKLLAHEKMEKFVEHFRSTLQNRRRKNGGAMEFTWEVLRKIAGGEVALALVDPGKDLAPSQVLLVDVTGRAPAAQAELQRVENDLKKQGAAKREIVTDGVTLVELRQKNEVRLLYFLADNVVCATDNLELAQGILSRLRKPSKECLAQITPFVDVAQRLKEDDQFETAPSHLRWFVKPIELVEARRKMVDFEPQERDLLATLRRTGFLAAQGAGGVFSFDGKQNDILSRTAVASAPRAQWKGTMPVLSFFNGPVTSAAKQPWVPKQLATYTSLNLDTLRSFDHLGPFFDDRIGGGGGTWKATLDTIRNNPQAAQVDIREEIVKNLTNAAVVITDHRDPISLDSERRLMAIAIKPGQEKLVREKLNRVCEFENYIKHEVNGVTIWEITEPAERKTDDGQDTDKPKPKGNDRLFDPNAGRKTGTNAGLNVRVPKPKVKREEPDAIGVAHGQVFYTNRISLLYKVVEQGSVVETRDKLGRDFDYRYIMKQIDAEMRKRGWDQVSLRRYDDSQEEIRGSYILARDGKLSESEGLIARLVRSAGSDDADPDAPPLIDGTLLPSFSGFAREYFKPAGLMMRTDEHGWFIVSFTLKE